MENHVLTLCLLILWFFSSKHTSSSFTFLFHILWVNIKQSLTSSWTFLIWNYFRVVIHGACKLKWKSTENQFHYKLWSKGMLHQKTWLVGRWYLLILFWNAIAQQLLNHWKTQLVMFWNTFPVHNQGSLSLTGYLHRIRWKEYICIISWQWLRL